MKKFYILLIAMALTAGTAFAQSNDSIERAKQQQELLKQQQKQQEELLKQQQKEQERLMKEQQKAAQKEQEERIKEQQKLQKEQQKEAEKAAKKEQDRIKREQIKAENKVKAEQKKAERKRKKQEHYAAWGRSPRLTADPSASFLFNRRLLGRNSLYNGMGYCLGFVFDYHVPIARRWDFNIGLGYRYTTYAYSHKFSSDKIEELTVDDFYGKEITNALHTVVLPLKISHISKDNERGLYLGVTPGFNINKISYINRFRCDLSVGSQQKFLIFSAGWELYYNLLPTFVGVEQKGRIHEFGVRFVL